MTTNDGRRPIRRALISVYDKAGLPASTFPAFREALEAMREEGFMFEPGNASRLKRRIIERTLTRCESEAPEEIEPLLTLYLTNTTAAAEIGRRVSSPRNSLYGGSPRLTSSGVSPARPLKLFACL